MKVAVIGPKTSGKTRLSNCIANVHIDGETEPTAGARILTFEREISALNKEGRGRTTTLCDVELWDCSGDQKFEACWPAIMKDLHGIVVVFDPHSKSQANDVTVWCEWFCKHADLRDRQAVIFAHGSLTDSHRPLKINLDDRSITIPITNVNLNRKEDNEGMSKPTTAEIQFTKFLEGCYAFCPDADV